MRPATLLLLAAAAGCSARARPDPIAPYTGTWEGRLYEADGRNIRLTWTWVQDHDSTGVLTLGRDGVEIPTRIVAATPDSIVVEAIRLSRVPLVDAPEFSLRFTGRASGNTMTGTAVASSPLGAAQRGRIEATRVDSNARR